LPSFPSAPCAMVVPVCVDRCLMLQCSGAIELSRATYRKMIQNLVWATAYNLVAIPAAGGPFVRRGVELPMSVSAVAMNLSTIIVAVNVQLLRRLKLQRATL
jgi:P-type Cu2+ transporter